MPNRLASETSPYLLQHAENPVDWYPWGEAARRAAEERDRPILLSIGYSSCHWCHVMERESFEDPAIAGLMNELFVNIKVDREERPDVDQIYMKAVQAMSGRGGWPMTVFLTPEGVPFFGGTYYPPVPRPGIPSFPDVLKAISDAWENRRDEVVAGGARLLDALAQSVVPPPSDATAGVELVDSAVAALERRYDPTHGGFGAAPKFPQPVTLEAVLRHHARTGDPTALTMAVHTLRRMAAGGMRDHLGGGFHRYSVDERWLVPHFEKMLYDNALLARVYLDAWKLTGSDDLAAIVKEVLDDLVDDFSDELGGFYAARDADSEGVEGRFYVWSRSDVAQLLGDDAALFCRAYDVTDRGNFEGANILHLPHPVEAIAAAEAVPTGELEAILARGRRVLFEARAEREAPFRDEKVIVAWNAFAIRAFAEAGAALGRPDYLERAGRAADFVWGSLRLEGRLLHSWIGGEASGSAFLDDYAGLGNALFSLHEATLDARWLDRALGLADEVLERFFDEDVDNVYDTAHDAETLIMRPRDATDGATPSGPSLAAELFARAGAVTDDERYRRAARAIVDAEVATMRQFGPAFGRMLSVVDRLEADPTEVAIVVPENSDPAEMMRAVHADFHRAVVITGRHEGASEGGRTAALPLLAGRGAVGGLTTAYVCRNYACELPETEPTEVRVRLRRAGG